jgi:uncharacterized protein YkwD
MVTEIACIDRNYRTVLDFTAKVCNWMDGQDWIFEYGLFDFQRTPADSFVSPAAQLMDKNGNLTELGNMYVHQQPMKVPANHALNLMALAAPSAVEGNGEQQQIGIADGAAGDGGETNDEHVSAQTGTAVCQEPNEETFFQAAAAVGEVAIPAVHVASALGADQQKALDLQNNKRKGKGLKPLVWDGQLAKNAEEYAKHLVAIGKLQHSTGDERPNQGENLAW